MAPLALYSHAEEIPLGWQSSCEVANVHNGPIADLSEFPEQTAPSPPHFAPRTPGVPTHPSKSILQRSCALTLARAMFITKLDPVHIANTWRRLRAMCVRVSDLIGLLGAFATRDAAAAVAQLGRIFRKLILVEAASCVVEERRRQPPRHPELVEGRRGAPRAFQLQLAPCRTQSLRSRRRAPRALERKPLASARLFQKFEALQRAIEAPQPYIQRLALLLHRRCRSDPHAAERCAMAPARPYRADPDDPRLVIEAIALALLASPAFVNTS
jgi:hypothetical protein